MIKKLFNEAESIIARESKSNKNEDFQRQYNIINSRKWDRVSEEADILNSLFIQASSYSVVRKYFKILYPENIWLIDDKYGTKFFKRESAPTLTYDEWVNAVVTWGNILLKEKHFSQVDTLESIILSLKKAGYSTHTPRSRIIYTLATALPKVKSEVLKDPIAFLDKLDSLSKSHPGKAFDYAKSFSKGIIQMGSALVCNFLKELGLLYYVKVDVHVSDFIDNISLCEKFNEKDTFIMSWLFAKEADIEPFFLDKILYVGGKYTKSQLMKLFDQYKDQYVSEINTLASNIKKYR